MKPVHPIVNSNDTAHTALRARNFVAKPANAPGTAVAKGDSGLPAMLGIAQAAAMIGVSTRQINRWRSRGIFPKPDFKEGRIVRWWVHSIYTWIAARGLQGAA